MESPALILWHSYLQSAPMGERTHLYGCLSEGLCSTLETSPVIPIDDRLMHAPEEDLDKIHYSWLIPFLRSLPETEALLFLSQLQPEQMKGVKHSLLLSNTSSLISSMGRNFLRKTIFETLATPNLLPSTSLPEDPLNGLLELSGEELESLIDLLSMHDLSIEMRHIIETAKLKEIYELLSKAQTTFLKTLIHKKEPVSFKKMGLLAWKGDKEALSSLLLQRGINRIAKALYEKSPSLLWHISRRINMDKGQLMIKLCSALDHPRASSILVDQVVELMNSLKQNNSS